MINKPKIREDWQKIVNDFSPKIQSKKDYCKERNINYNTFRNWYFKLNSSTGLTKREGEESKLGVVSEVTKKIINKDFIGFKLAPKATKINLPNGINIEVATEDVIGLIKKLMYVA